MNETLAGIGLLVVALLLIVHIVAFWKIWMWLLEIHDKACPDEDEKSLERRISQLEEHSYGKGQETYKP